MKINPKMKQLLVAKRVLICGDRNWHDQTLIDYYVEKLREDVIIIHGACRGADLMAEDSAKKFERQYMGFPARWKANGKSAGPIRNHLMLIEGQPDFVLAFHDNIARSKGTANMVRLANTKGVPTMVVSRKGEK